MAVVSQDRFTVLHNMHWILFAQHFSEEVSIKVDISELTWEQKEKVLRFLFAKMNSAKAKQQHSAPAINLGASHTQSLPALTEKEALYVQNVAVHQLDQ